MWSLKIVLLPFPVFFFSQPFWNSSEIISVCFHILVLATILFPQKAFPITASGIQALTTTQSLIIHCITHKEKTNKIMGSTYSEPTAFGAGLAFCYMHMYHIPWIRPLKMNWWGKTYRQLCIPSNALSIPIRRQHLNISFFFSFFCLIDAAEWSMLSLVNTCHISHLTDTLFWVPAFD